MMFGVFITQMHVEQTGRDAFLQKLLVICMIFDGTSRIILYFCCFGGQVYNANLADHTDLVDQGQTGKKVRQTRTAF